MSVCWAGKSSDYFLWAHEMQEYTFFDLDSEMIIYGRQVSTCIMYPTFTFVTLESILYYLSGAVGTEAVRNDKK